MEKIIHVALILSGKHNVETLIADASKKNIQIEVFTDLKSVENTEFHDVILVQETFLTSFQKQKFENSSIIVISNDLLRVSELYPKVSHVQAFTIISLPLDSKVVIKYIDEAYQNLISTKQEKAAQEEVGKKIIVTSFSNGVGKTMTVFNLVNKLTYFFPENSLCLVDMNRPFSEGKAMINIDDTYNWHTLRAILKESKVSQQKVANILYHTKYKFSYLGGPSDFNANQPLSAKEFTNLADSLQEFFRVTFFDLATISTKEDIEYLKNADKILVIINMESSSILNAKRGLEYLKENHEDILSNMIFVINRVDEEKGKTPALVASRLGIEFIGAIDNDPEAVETFVENGKLFDDKTLLLNKQYYDLAEQLMKVLY